METQNHTDDQRLAGHETAARVNDGLILINGEKIQTARFFRPQKIAACPPKPWRRRKFRRTNYWKRE
jgi:hypothetical protein